MSSNRESAQTEGSYTTDYTTYSALHEQQIGTIPVDVPRTISAICPMSRLQIYAYGVGHFFNDIVGACWFNYLLLYLTLVNPIVPPDDKTHSASQVAGVVMLVGQVADSIATPLIGGLMDKAPNICGMGKKRPFYIIGTIFVGISFFNVFTPCTLCRITGHETNPPFSLVYANYILWPVLLNVSWPMVQVAHMSMPPSLSNSRSKRDKLNNLRNAFTFFSNLSCFIIALFLFKFLNNANLEYETLALCCTVFGVLCSITFMLGVPEKRLTDKAIALRKNANSFFHQFKESNYSAEERKVILAIKNDYVLE